MNGKKVAVVGATGAVGREMIKVLADRNFPVSELVALASSRSAGKNLTFRGEEVTVKELKPDSFEGIDIALFSAGASISKEFAPRAARAGAVAIDNSSAWRMDSQVPLVVPEVNPEDVKWHNGIIANPNCSTIQMVVVLQPIHRAAKIKRVVVSTYQAVSGSGQKAIDELTGQVKAWSDNKPLQNKVYPYRIAFNALPHIDIFLENSYTREEMKMVNETQKIMGDDSIKLTATAVRIPVFRAHSESVNIETEVKISAAEVKKILSGAPGVKVVDDPANNQYPLAIDAEGKDDTLVGRIREDESIEKGINLWIVSDNLLKGAALNAVQIAELLL